jgi:hypothetical protein
MLVNKTTVKSATLAAVVYDGHRDLLQLHFRDGTTYHYFGVPAQTYQELLASPSKGGYFNRSIRDQFPYAALQGTPGAKR